MVVGEKEGINEGELEGLLDGLNVKVGEGEG
jgi:hypothetical protein